MERVLTMPVLEPRAADAHKGTYGRVLVVAGSRGMSGAAVLCAGAALRSGAGLVRVATPEGVWPQVAAANPCYMTAPLPQDAAGLLADSAEADLLSLAQANDVVAVGPGLGRSPAITTLVTALLERARVPMVLDADGINAMQGHTDRLRNRPAPLVLTPHPGEFAGLLGCDTATIQAQRQEQAFRFAAEHRLVLVLKGHGTLVTDGQRLFQNTTGNPGMATGGTGDVLTGVIAALLAQGLEPFAAAQFGVHVHGMAGDLARDEVGEVSLLAADVLRFLPRAFRIF